MTKKAGYKVKESLSIRGLYEQLRTVSTSLGYPDEEPRLNKPQTYDALIEEIQIIRTTAHQIKFERDTYKEEINQLEKELYEDEDDEDDYEE